MLDAWGIDVLSQSLARVSSTRIFLTLLLSARPDADAKNFLRPATAIIDAPPPVVT
jgi:hypothetical protein